MAYEMYALDGAFLFFFLLLDNPFSPLSRDLASLALILKSVCHSVPQRTWEMEPVPEKELNKDFETSDFTPGLGKQKLSALKPWQNSAKLVLAPKYQVYK